MTSDEIKQKAPHDLSPNSWLREIALQLALANEPKKPGPKAKGK